VSNAVGLCLLFGNLAIAPVSIGRFADWIDVLRRCRLMLSLGGFSLGIWSFGALAFGCRCLAAARSRGMRRMVA